MIQNKLKEQNNKCKHALKIFQTVNIVITIPWSQKVKHHFAIYKYFVFNVI